MIGKKIKALRQEHKITQAELARILNVTRSAVALWETNKTLPDIKNIIELANVFNISTDYLLGIEDESGRKINIKNSFNNNSGNINFRG